jgi:hypothetical protein
MFCKVLSSISGLHPLSASSTAPPAAWIKHVSDNDKSPVIPVGNYWSNAIYLTYLITVFSEGKLLSSSQQNWF